MFNTTVFVPPLTVRDQILRPIVGNQADPMYSAFGLSLGLTGGILGSMGSMPQAVGSAERGVTQGAGKTVKATNLNDVFENPSLLKNMTPDEVKALANKEGWQAGTLSKGSQAGNGLTIRDGKDRLIQWHPGGGHHGAEPYWKVSSGTTGTQRIGPQFDNPNGGGATK